MFIAAIALAAYTEQYFFIAIPFAAALFYAGWQQPYLVFLLLMVTIPFSIQYNLTPTLGTDWPDELLMLFVSGLFIAYGIYSPASISTNALKHPLIILLIISIGWMLIPVIFSTNPLISFKFLFAKSWYTGAFVLAPLVIFKQKKLVRITFIALSCSMVLVTLIIMVRHSEYGFRFSNINDAVAPFFRNHVNYSAMLVCFIPVLYAFFRGEKSKDRKGMIAAFIIILLLALFFSFARGAWVALLAGLVAYWMVKKRMLVQTYVIAVLIIIAGLFWLKNNDRYLKYANDFTTTVFHKNFKEHLVATYQLKDVSTAERFYRWIAGIRMIKDNWLTGYGPNTFYDNYKGYTLPAFKTWVSENKDHSTVHNYFLLVAIEQGLPGLLLLLILFGALLYYAQYLYHRTRDTFYQATAITAGVVVVMIIVVNFLSDLIETDKIGSLFFLCLSVLVVTDINTRKESDPSPDIQRVP